MTIALFALPLLALPWLVEATDRGRVAARLVIVGLALGALLAGAGTLEPAGLGRYSAAASGNALFVSLSVGILLGCLLPWPPRWPLGATLLGIPLAVVALIPLVSGINVGGLLLGAVLGALPSVVGSILPRPRQVPGPGSASGWWQLAALLIALAEPLLIIGLLPLPWLLPIGRRWWPESTGVRRILPAIALVFAVVLLWLALTVAGDPLVMLRGYGRAAPLSPAAGRLLAVLGYGMILTLLAPWPFGRLGPELVPVPALMVLGFRFATQLAPQGMAAWFATAGIVLVISALVSAFRRDWQASFGAIAVLTALTGSTAGFGAGLVLAMVAIGPALMRPWRTGDADPVTFNTSPLLTAALGGALAVAIAVLIDVEVVLATVLAAGIAAALARISPRRLGTSQ